MSYLTVDKKVLFFFDGITTTSVAKHRFHEFSIKNAIINVCKILQVSIADESELMNLGWNQHHSGGAASFPGLQSRFATLTAPGRHEHARWTQALEETKSWKEDLERDVSGRTRY